LHPGCERLAPLVVLATVPRDDQVTVLAVYHEAGELDQHARDHHVIEWLNGDRPALTDHVEVEVPDGQVV
jgi:hypothetical protein